MLVLWVLVEMVVGTAALEGSAFIIFCHNACNIQNEPFDLRQTRQACLLVCTFVWMCFTDTLPIAKKTPASKLTWTLEVATCRLISKWAQSGEIHAHNHGTQNTSVSLSKNLRVFARRRLKLSKLGRPYYQCSKTKEPGRPRKVISDKNLIF